MIAFLQPLALLGLAAAAIPPLLHLLARRVPPTVVFPAVRYLAATEREHSRRLKLRNLLLMLLRTAVIVLLVLAAARPVVRVAAGGGHPPTALALVVDNSLSSAAVVGGRPILDLLRQRAHAVLDRVSPDDRLWLVLADGVPRRTRPAAAAAALDSLTPWPVRLDVSAAARTAAGVVAGQPLSAEVVVISDLQASAFTPGEPAAVRALLWRAPAPPENRAIDSAFAEPREWTPEGRVVAAVSGTLRQPGAVRVWAEGRELARGVASAGDLVALEARAPTRGWLAVRVELDADELRLDDRWWLAVRAEEPAAVAAEPGAGPFVAQAIAVLREGGRVREGRAVVLDDRVPAGAAVLFPPADPALVGALNRSLAARGSSWRLSGPVDGEWSVSGDVGPAEGVAVFRRYRLEGTGGVIARAGGEPWLVASGGIVIVASRMEEPWTDLPIRAGFVPFLDFVVNRLAARESWIVRATPGAAVRLPPGMDALLAGGRRPVPRDARLSAPLVPGVYFLEAAGDTVGALEVNHDRRESRLAPVDGGMVRATLGDGARLVDDRALDRELFGGARRAGLAGTLLAAALLAALAELAVATLGGRVREAEA